MAPNQILEILSDLGVMFLLFAIGLKMRSSELMRVGGAAIAVAASGVALSFLASRGVTALSGVPRNEGIFTGPGHGRHQFLHYRTSSRRASPPRYPRGQNHPRRRRRR
jgi:hypothetical protein